ncbi:RluA family pseudouridine synthase [Benzoatithermus flavus]|uniref:Pseudouridine synthase n=1 Tax=Benzoatithermus flavus TaxID=3108223 RepID=A0ABU8XYP7_9PROT
MSAVTHLEVRPEEEGWRFDRWAKAHFPGLSFGQLQKLCRTGQFRLDGKRVEANARLAHGQIVRVPPLDEAAKAPAAPEKPAHRPLRAEDAAFIRSLVMYEDERLIAFNKPAGLAVQGGSGTTRHIDGLLAAFARKGERPRLVHRLDRDTSGLLVVARSAEAARELTFAFQQHKVRKLYWAIVLKGPERNHGLIDVPLVKAGPVGQEKMRTVVRDEEDAPEARNARTRFMVLARAGKVAAWVGLMPLTGRTHQLRVHCAAIGTPILGDGKYGGKAAHPTGAPKGLMLHARELELPQPKGRPLRLTAEPPASFREALRWLGLGVPELPGASLDEWPD